MTSTPWYQQCGMRIYEHGAAANIFVPPLLLVFRYLRPAQVGMWIVGLLLLIAYQKSTTGSTKSKGKKLQPYLHICLPMYFASLVLCAALETWPLRMIVPVVLMLVVGKVGLMSVCLHRYAAHGAFKCGPVTNAGLKSNILHARFPKGLRGVPLFQHFILHARARNNACIVSDRTHSLQGNYTRAETVARLQIAQSCAKEVKGLVGDSARCEVLLE